ncbi:MAG: 50S ribosomal protein L11 methyltransferase [Clostridia bacterium]|nr:50S ribosomal protein L11 methyltransferase [Clostridia bacterium]MDE7329029.1 50S ribosomal protein L11 methyltransferase [Clostridia bacterium]
MKFYEVTVETTTEASELVAEILTDEGSDGVGIYDGKDLADISGSEVVWDYIEEHLTQDDGKVLVKGYFNTENFDKTRKKIDKRLKFLKENCPFEYGSLEVSVGTVDDNDWVESWKENFRPIKTGKITIVPEWIEYAPEEGKNIVKIDPGMAFGTGEHESTKLCLLLLQSLELEGKSVVDVGTGSGILALAAARLGAKKVEAYDIDENAVKSAKENCKLNALQSKVKIEQANLLDKSSGKFNVALANITADVLISLSASLGNFLKDDGVIITSGIILKREEDVKEAFENAGFKLSARASMGEWVAMRFTK